MVEVTDTYPITITVIEHGIAKILNVVVPTDPIYINTPFDISYEVKNTSSYPDTLWAHIKDEDGNVIEGSCWEVEAVPPNGTIPKTFNHPGFDTSGAKQLTIEAGHK